MKKGEKIKMLADTPAHNIVVESSISEKTIGESSISESSISETPKTSQSSQLPLSEKTISESSISESGVSEKTIDERLKDVLGINDPDRLLKTELKKDKKMLPVFLSMCDEKLHYCSELKGTLLCGRLDIATIRAKLRALCRYGYVEKVLGGDGVAAYRRQASENTPKSVKQAVATSIVFFRATDNVKRVLAYALDLYDQLEQKEKSKR